MRPLGSATTWRRMVLQNEKAPAWLAADSPQGDVVLSSRCRIGRCLTGYRFPNSSDRFELIEVRERIVSAFANTGFEVLKHLTEVERDFFVGGRLVSPEFEFDEPGRGMLLSEDRAVSILINEEDHIRIQALTAGWSAESAHQLATTACEHLSNSVDFAWSPRFGYLTASPYNAGHGQRLSAMFHLIGLAHLKRLPSVLKALMGRRIATRGLFGESSRAIGAFVQVSVTDARRTEFMGACEYLLREERIARAEVGQRHLEERTTQTLDYIQGSPKMSLADALRVLGWIRWASVSSLPGVVRSPRDVDAALAALEVRGDADDDRLARQRADFLRGFVEGK